MTTKWVYKLRKIWIDTIYIYRVPMKLFIYKLNSKKKINLITAIGEWESFYKYFGIPAKQRPTVH